MLVQSGIGSRNSAISSSVKPSMLGISVSMSSSRRVMGWPSFEAENLSKKYRTHHVRRRLSRSTGDRLDRLDVARCMPMLSANRMAVPL